MPALTAAARDDRSWWLKRAIDVVAAALRLRRPRLTMLVLRLVLVFVLWGAFQQYFYDR